MKYEMTHPCGECPFRRDGIRLTPARATEVAMSMLAGNGFPCHRTIEYTDEGHRELPTTQHCAGALIFAEKNQASTQMMRIAERLGFYDFRKLTGHQVVFENLREMIAANKGRR